MPEPGFQLKRVILVSKNDLSRKMKIYLLINGSVLLLMLYNFFGDPNSLFDVMNSVTQTSFRVGSAPVTQGNMGIFKFHLDWFPRALMITGSIVTSVSFLEYANMDSRQFHMALPATLYEKWFSKLLFCTVIYPMGFAIAYQGFAYLLNSWATDMGHELVTLHLTDPYLWKSMGIFVFIQCLVFLGAVLYQKYSLFKTLLLFGSLFIISTVIFNLTLNILVPEISLSGSSQFLPSFSLTPKLDSSQLYYSGSWSDFLQTTIQPATTEMMCLVLSISCLVLSFYKFKEMEA